MTFTERFIARFLRLILMIIGFVLELINKPWWALVALWLALIVVAVTDHDL